MISTFCILLILVASNNAHGRVRRSSKRFPEDYYSIVPLDGYTTQTDSLFAYIINAVELGDETCDRQFHNCLYNVLNKDEPAKHYNHELPLSSQCSLLQKAKYCLHSKNYSPDCPYKRITQRVQTYWKHLNKNIEACSYHLPYEKSSSDSSSDGDSNSNKASQANKQLNASTRLTLPFSILFFIVIIIPYVIVVYL